MAGLGRGQGAFVLDGNGLLSGYKPCAQIRGGSSATGFDWVEAKQADFWLCSDVELRVPQDHMFFSLVGGKNGLDSVC